MMKNIKIIEVKSEIGAGTRGASLGIDALKIAALDFMSNFFVNFPSDVVETENNLLYEPVESPYAKRIKGVKTIYERIAKTVEENIKSGLFPLVLSGDHSSAGGTIAGIKMANPKNRLGVVWIDAHADFHSPYTTPSGNMHGMPLAISLAEDNKDCTVHKPNADTIKVWEELKNIGNIKPKILPQDLVYIALRDTEKEEDYILKKLGIKIIPVSEVRKKGVEHVVRQTLLTLQHCDDIYVSFDVDSLDSSISRGTGTPVANGLKEREAEDLLASLMQNHKICCFEITEVNPTLDKENMMAEIAFNILQRCANILLIN
ncbi:MAG TPA: arginase [Chitinophagaceae bacterium]|nr:MAG: arginase/agmatinase/formiminoglutamase [Bacteroidetes bacterium OLB11]HMN32647.1 arginase [Chitinophagaceae bacterium]